MKNNLFILVRLMIPFIFFSCALEAGVSWNYVQSSEFQNGWVNSPGLQPLAYGKDSLGMVHLTGQIQDADALSSSSIIFTLPEDYRPAYSKHFPATVYTSIYDQGRLFISSIDGTVSIYASADILEVFIGEIIYSTE
jgi:hypothetical protein